uniref:BTB domain-containing protein n=1 Tax=Strongyloides papillosus TaxID=174720 RepID=A0A0N5B4Q8_STREA
MLMKKKTMQVIYDKKSTTWHISNLIKKEDLVKQVFEGRAGLKIFIMGCELYYYINYDTENINNNISNDISTLFNSKRYIDIILKIGENEINVHKCILASRSPIFDNLLKYGNREASTKIIIVDSNKDAVEAMVNYLYINKISNMNNYTMDLLRLSDFFCIKGLKLLMECYFINAINSANAIQYLIKADIYSALTLKKWCMMFICFNLEEIMNSDSEKWNTFIKEHPTLVSQILQLAVNK